MNIIVCSNVMPQNLVDLYKHSGETHFCTLKMEAPGSTKKLVSKKRERDKMCSVMWNSAHAIRNVIKIITITCNPLIPVATRNIDTQDGAKTVNWASLYS